MATTLGATSSAGLWVGVFTVNTNASLYLAILTVPLSLLGAFVAIGLSVAAGRHRGANRVLGVLTGIMLLAPLVAYTWHLTRVL